MTAFPRARPVGQQQRPPQRPKVHGFADSGKVDFWGKPICDVCDNVKSTRVHELPETPPDALEVDERKLGEA